MFRFVRIDRLCLRNKIAAVFCVIIRPAVYFRNLALPVAVARINGRCPLKRGGIPRVLRTQLPSFKNGIKEVEHEQQVYGEHNYGHNRNHVVQAAKLVEAFPKAEVKVTTRYAGHAHVVHWPEDKIGANKGYPKVQITHCVVQVTAEHFREPMVYTGKHPKEGRYTHYNVEVRHYKVGIVKVNVYG